MDIPKLKASNNWLWLFVPGALLLVYSLSIQLFSLDLKTSVTVGDLASLVGAALVFLSFQQQREANKLQNAALKAETDRTNALNKFNQLISLMDDINTLYDKFRVEYTYLPDPGIMSKNGSEALALFNQNLLDQKEGKISIMAITNMTDAIWAYTNFLNVLVFTAKGIIEYKGNDDHAKEVLKIKFKNLVDRFSDTIMTIRFTTLVPTDNITHYRLINLSEQFLELVEKLNSHKGTEYLVNDN